MHYNYVYFNNSYGTLRENDPCGYDAICLKDTEKLENFKLVACPLDYAIYPIRWLFSACNSSCIPKVLKKISQRIWFPFYFKDDLAVDQPVCFIIATLVIKDDYIRYLRKKYPKCRIVLVRRDLIEACGLLPTIRNKKKIYDLVFSYDKGDSEKYGLIYFQEIESKLSLHMSSSKSKFDVFFAGAAKDRLPRLLEAYEIFTKAGLKCNFYITGVPAEQRKILEGIEYADSFMPYIEMLQRSIDARCMLEINQSGACGYTSRFLEAVMYNKKLITDNLSVKKDCFYDSRYIQCIKSVEEIDPSFVLDGWNLVDYHYNDEFSPIRLIHQIDKELGELDRKEGMNFGTADNT